MRVHFIEEEDLIVAYFPDTMRFFEINLNTKSLIESILKEEDKSSISQKYNISLDEYNDFGKKIRDYAVDQRINLRHQNLENFLDKTVLAKLVINVSNTCNLRCKYCYANGGSYSSTENIMDMDLLEKTLNRFYDNFKEIKTIQIFGGEPLLNLPAIEYICEYVEKKFNSGEIPNLPNVGLVTNGTIVNEKFIDLIKKYKLKVTVSLDGPPVANDAMRIFSNGLGTSETIVRNIKRLKKETGEPNTIEVTYNKNHVLNKISVLDIIKYVNNNFENTLLHIVPVSASEDYEYKLDDLQPFVNSISDIFESAFQGDAVTYSLFQRIIDGLKDKNYAPYICEAGFGTISVSTKGDIFPCFMFTDVESIKLGTIFDNNVFDSKEYKENTDKFLRFNKFENNFCRDCFYNTLCSSCLGMNYVETGEVFKVESPSCEMFRNMAEKVIIGLTKAKKIIKQPS